MRISIIAALSDNNVIGRDNRLPWRLPADMKSFKRLTTGHTIIMGRKTFEALKKPLPNRVSIIVTSNTSYAPEGVRVANSLDGALVESTGQEEVFVIGGERIYREALPIADRMYLTHVHACVAGDTWFPQFDPGDWEMTREENHEADDENPYSFTFRVYDRAKPSASRQHAARP